MKRFSRLSRRGFYEVLFAYFYQLAVPKGWKPYKCLNITKLVWRHTYWKVTAGAFKSDEKDRLWKENGCIMLYIVVFDVVCIESVVALTNRNGKKAFSMLFVLSTVVVWMINTLYVQAAETDKINARAKSHPSFSHPFNQGIHQSAQAACTCGV